MNLKIVVAILISFALPVVVVGIAQRDRLKELVAEHAASTSHDLPRGVIYFTSPG